MSAETDDGPTSGSAASGQSRAKRSISRMVDLAFEYGAISSIGQLLDRVASLWPYSPFNALLVILQRPAASFLLPPQEWEERFGRSIRPGEQPIVMLQPFGPVMFLFDVSQTEAGRGADRLPMVFHNPYAMADIPAADVALQWLTENTKKDGVRVTPSRHGFRSAGCMYRAEPGPVQRVLVRRRPPEHEEVPIRFETLLNGAYSPTEQLATLAHELGHLYCGHLGADRGDWWRDRRNLGHISDEFEAESAARVVFRRLAPDVELPDHLAQYLPPGAEPPPYSLEKILKASGRVIEMAEGWVPRKLPDRR